MFCNLMSYFLCEKNGICRKHFTWKQLGRKLEIVMEIVSLASKGDGFAPFSD